MKNIHSWLSRTIRISEVVVFLFMKRDEFWEFILLLDVLGNILFFINVQAGNLLFSIWNFAQCHVATRMGGRFEREWTHVSEGLSLFVAHLKLSQYFYDDLFLFLAAPVLHFWPRAFSSQGSGAPLPCSMWASCWGGFSCCKHGLQLVGSAAVAHGLSCAMACGIFPDQGSIPWPLHWQGDS